MHWTSAIVGKKKKKIQRWKEITRDEETNCDTCFDQIWGMKHMTKDLCITLRKKPRLFITCLALCVLHVYMCMWMSVRKWNHAHKQVAHPMLTLLTWHIAAIFVKTATLCYNILEINKQHTIIHFSSRLSSTITFCVAKKVQL